MSNLGGPRAEVDRLEREREELRAHWYQDRDRALTAEARLRKVEALADDEFAVDDTTDLPEWGGDFERGAMWAFAEAARLLREALA